MNKAIVALTITVAMMASTAQANEEQLFNFGHIYGFYKLTSSVVCKNESTPSINRLSSDFKDIIGEAMSNRSVMQGSLSGDQEARNQAANSGMTTAAHCADIDAKAKKILDQMSANKAPQRG